MIDRHRTLRLLDAAMSSGITALVVLTVLGFGGAVWWARPLVFGIALALVAAWAARGIVAGEALVIRSPMLALGGMVLTLGVIQLLPMPARLADRMAATARHAHVLGVMPDQVLRDDPSAVLPAAGSARTPATVDRAATLRWLVSAAACLAVLAIVLHHVDRLGRTVSILGALVAMMFLCTTVGIVRWGTGSEGWLDVLEPGDSAAWAPSPEDLLVAPGETLLRPIGEGTPKLEQWALSRAASPSTTGALAGGTDGYVALCALILPLALGLVLLTLAPRGSRLGLRERLRHCERGGVALMLLGLTALSALLAGRLAQDRAWLALAAGLLVAGLPAMRSGLRFTAPLATGLVLLALLAGVLLRGSAHSRPSGTLDRWREAAAIALDFPVLGAGMGAYAAVEPYYKSEDAATTAAGSTLLQWWAESGLIGLALLGLGGIGLVVRLPAAIARVGAADAPIAFALVGSLVAFCAYATIQWSVELLAVAVVASIVFGLLERWLCGGTDLFVETPSLSL